MVDDIVHKIKFLKLGLKDVLEEQGANSEEGAPGSASSEKQSNPISEVPTDIAANPHQERLKEELTKTMDIIIKNNDGLLNMSSMTETFEVLVHKLSEMNANLPTLQSPIVHWISYK